jgi:hypothetical protein
MSQTQAEVIVISDDETQTLGSEDTLVLEQEDDSSFYTQVLDPPSSPDVSSTPPPLYHGRNDEVFQVVERRRRHRRRMETRRPRAGNMIHHACDHLVVALEKAYALFYAIARDEEQDSETLVMMSDTLQHSIAHCIKHHIEFKNFYLR